MTSERLNEAILELVKTVSSLEARMAHIDAALTSLQEEVQALKNIAAQAKGFSIAARAIWAILGLLIGAGGFKLVELI